jgi:hypothetical protein
MSASAHGSKKGGTTPAAANTRIFRLPGKPAVRYFGGRYFSRYFGPWSL